VIATCITQEDVDYTEEILIIQYNSRNKEFGYNIQPGGNVSSPSEETREKMSKATFKQIAEQGHPSLGKKRSDEQRAQMRETRLKNPINYTDEIRNNMSEAHIGNIISEEQRQKMSTGIKKAWEIRNSERMLKEDIRCFAPGCDVVGTGNSYHIIEGIRYCNKHSLRLIRTNSLELLPRTSHNKGKSTSEEVLVKLRGRTPANKIQFSEDQIKIILDTSRSIKSLSREFGYTEKVIKRIRNENINK
jgi:hypothetical protein